MSDPVGDFGKAALIIVGGAFLAGGFLVIGRNLPEGGGAGRHPSTVTTPNPNPVVPRAPCVKVAVLPNGPIYYAQEVKQTSPEKVTLVLTPYRTIQVTSRQGFIIDPNPITCWSYNP